MKMKSIIVTTMLLFVVTLPLNAQWNIGGVLDINRASITVDPKPSSEEYSSRLGIGLGVVLDRPLTGQIDLHTEPMVLQKGGKIEERGDEITFKLSYFEVPVMFRYNFQTSGSARPYVMAGPSLGFLLSSKFAVKNGPEIDAKDETKSLDIALGFGGGVSIPRGKMTLFAEVRFDLGLTNINDDKSDETTVKNRGLQVAVGATVPLGK